MPEELCQVSPKSHYMLQRCNQTPALLAIIFCPFQVATPTISAHISISLEFAFKIELIIRLSISYLLQFALPFCQPHFPLMLPAFESLQCANSNSIQITEVGSFSFSFSQSCQSSLTLHCVFFLLLLLQCCRSSSLILQSNCCLLKIQKSYKCIIHHFEAS